MSQISFQQRFQAAASRRGQTLVEYALILAVIAIVAIAMMIQLTGKYARDLQQHQFPALPREHRLVGEAFRHHEA